MILSRLEDRRRTPTAGAPRFLRAGERVGGLIYGTIVTLSVVVAGGRAYPDESGAVAELVLVTSTVFWLAHVYAHALGDSLAHGRRLDLRAVRRVARHELSVRCARRPGRRGHRPWAARGLRRFGQVRPRGG